MKEFYPSQPSFGGLVDEYYFSNSPILISDMSCDYDSCGAVIADFDRNSFAYCNDYGPKYHVTLTCGDLRLLKKVLEYAKNVSLYDDDFTVKKNDTLNAQLKYIGRVDNEEELPIHGEVGEMYAVGEELAVYTGNKWEYITTSPEVKNEYVTYHYIEKYKRKHKILYKC